MLFFLTAVFTAYLPGKGNNWERSISFQISTFQLAAPMVMGSPVSLCLQRHFLLPLVDLDP